MPEPVSYYTFSDVSSELLQLPSCYPSFEKTTFWKPWRCCLLVAIFYSFQTLLLSGKFDHRLVKHYVIKFIGDHLLQDWEALWQRNGDRLKLHVVGFWD
ncbi:hypothetical protein FRX31_007579 [Thalictrum thalictroides]|uniref:Uncharacterized protein n=1 Tax=Thalictrum thalictroides TaxID=46969 RepID=A0A7J6X1U2_THATH|nr:hypothetical protein FRX31_007579 [Thalictrum thalictroides]